MGNQPWIWKASKVAEARASIACYREALERGSDLRGNELSQEDIDWLNRSIAAQQDRITRLKAMSEAECC